MQRYAMFALFGLLVGVQATAPEAHASIAYAVQTGGAVLRFDPYSTDAPVLMAGSWGSNVDGFTIDPQGAGWGISWEGSLRRYDLAAGTTIPAGLVPRPNGTGFFKDLAWDAANNRILAMHFAVTVTIGTLDPATHEFLSLGTVSGITPVGHMTAMAVSPDGSIVIGDNALGIVWDLTSRPGPPGSGFDAVRRAHQGSASVFGGMEYDPVTGDLLTSASIQRVLADGSLQLLRGDVSGTDLAFVPVPSPASGGVLCLLAGIAARRRRSS